MPLVIMLFESFFKCKLISITKKIQIIKYTNYNIDGLRLITIITTSLSFEYIGILNI